MSNQNLSIALRLFLESRGLGPGLQQTERAVGNTANRMQRDFDRVGRLVNSVQQRVAALGLGIGALQNQRISAHLDQDLNRIGQTAGATRQQVKAMRQELFALSRDKTGVPVDQLRDSLGALIAANLTWEQGIQTNRAINPASRVSGADAVTLAKALTVGAASFKIDLSEPGRAVQMLDEMIVAGEAGKAELEDLAASFSAAGNKAAEANLSFRDTLALIEVLAQTTPIPQLPVMAESTLRLFTNNSYATRAEKASGVPFYNKDKSRRNPADVLVELAAKVQSAPNDQARARLLDKILKGADLTTISGLGQLFREGELEKMRDISSRLEQAGGAVARKLPDAMDNAVAQGERLRSILRQVGDDLATPINKAFADAMDVGLRPKAQGGLELSNAEILGAGALTFAAAGIAGKLLRKIPVLGDTAGVAAGVAQGKVLQEMAGVTPVFVTNWPSGGFGGGGPADALGGAAGAAALARSPNPLGLLGLGAAAFVGIKAGEGLYNRYGDTDPFIRGADAIFRKLDQALALVSDSAARRAELMDPARAASEFTGTIKVQLDQNGRLNVAGIDSSDNLDLKVGTGPLRALGN